MKAVCCKYIFLCTLVLFCIKVGAQEYSQVSARSIALVGISSCLADCWSVFGNQAGLSAVDEKYAVGISYSNYFLMKELSVMSAFFAIPVKQNVFALSFYRYGYNVYNENKIGLAFEKKLAPNFSAGFQFNYFFMHLPENEKQPGCVSFEGGIQYTLKEKLIFGMHCYNPFQSLVESESMKYKLPCLFRFGAGTKITNDLWLFAELEKDLRYDLQSKFGIEYKILNRVWLRGGVTGRDNCYSLGAAYLTKRVTADFAWEYTYRLGSTPSVALSYHFR